jgi:hypothetical protein
MHSYTDELFVEKTVVPQLIGKGGHLLTKLRESSGTKINIGQPEANDQVKISLQGTKKDVDATKKALLEKARKLVINDRISSF